MLDSLSRLANEGSPIWIVRMYVTEPERGNHSGIVVPASSVAMLLIQNNRSLKPIPISASVVATVVITRHENPNPLFISLTCCITFNLPCEQYPRASTGKHPDGHLNKRWNCSGNFRGLRIRAWSSLSREGLMHCNIQARNIAKLIINVSICCNSLILLPGDDLLSVRLPRGPAF